MSVVCPGAVATNIFFRSLDYTRHPETPLPPDAIGIEQAGGEILDGIRNGDQVIPLNDDARRLYQAIREGRPEYVEEAMRIVKARALEDMEATAAAPAVGT
ncbi:MAG TPA: hypothetical protein VKP69_14005 [Isosphaeraceae bacterium]|nr:hypothetical protein [Isosphaeraceae bacterium]